MNQHLSPLEAEDYFKFLLYLLIKLFLDLGDSFINQDSAPSTGISL